MSIPWVVPVSLVWSLWCIIAGHRHAVRSVALSFALMLAWAFWKVVL